MLKSSMFNIFSSDGKVVYNSLSKSIIYPTREEKFFIQEPNRANELNAEKRALIQNGFVVGSEMDEILEAKTRLKRHTHNSSMLMITIVVTRQCNFRCAYCYEEFSSQRFTKGNEDALFQHIVQNIHRYSGIELGWFGGEPLLELDSILRICKKIQIICYKYHKIFVSGMTTNGYYLSLGTFNMLYQSGIRSFCVTLDGNEQNHNRLRPLGNGQGTYNIILKNLQEIAKETTDLSYKMTIRMNVYEDNLIDVETWLHDNSGLFDNRNYMLQLCLICDYGGSRVEKLVDRLSPYESLLPLMQKALERNIRLSNLEDLLFSPMGGICYAAVTDGFVMKPDNSIVKCTLKIDGEEYCVGTVRQGKINLDAHKIEKWTTIKDRETCGKCSRYPLCAGEACPALNNLENEEACPSLLKKDYLEQLLDYY